MIKNSLRALATSLVLVPSLAFAKAPAPTQAPAKSNVSTPVKANTPAAPAKGGESGR